MLVIGFSKRLDVPKLEHCRKSIFSHVLWDATRGQARLDWAWIGENELCYENALTNPGSILLVDEEMFQRGRYIFSFRKPEDPIKFQVTIEKFEIRRRLWGPLVGYRAEIALPKVSFENSYLVSKSLSDLNQKLFGIFVSDEHHEGLDKKTSIAVMSGW